MVGSSFGGLYCRCPQQGTWDFAMVLEPKEASPGPALQICTHQSLQKRMPSPSEGFQLVF